MKSPQLKLIETEDGSHSLYREDLHETYHSFNGARGESLHIFIEHGLSTLAKPSLKVFEVGMGTGLNVFLTALFASENAVKVEMVSIEPIPVDLALYQQLNYGKTEEERNLLQKIHQGAWEHSVSLSPYCELTKIEQTLEQVSLPTNHFDMIYFDAFAPSKQPDIWSTDNLEKCFSCLLPGGVMTTYCAQGQFKRNLKAVGFEVETLPGAMGKKEMVRAKKPL